MVALFGLPIRIGCVCVCVCVCVCLLVVHETEMPVLRRVVTRVGWLQVGTPLSLVVDRHDK